MAEEVFVGEAIGMFAARELAMGVTIGMLVDVVWTSSEAEKDSTRNKKLKGVDVVVLGEADLLLLGVA